MTKNLPTLFGLSIKNIADKIKFLRQINLDFVVILYTKSLIQSIDLTYARYQFLKDKNLIVDENNYSLLFYNAKKFEKRFSITKDELLERYKYDEYKRQEKIIRYV